jgi:hypothetical protein
MMQAILQTNAFKHGPRFVHGRLARQFQRKHHIFQGRQIGQKLEGLEDEADMGRAHGRACFLVQ